MKYEPMFRCVLKWTDHEIKDVNKWGEKDGGGDQ